MIAWLIGSFFFAGFITIAALAMGATGYLDDVESKPMTNEERKAKSQKALMIIALGGAVIALLGQCNGVLI